MHGQAAAGSGVVVQFGNRAEEDGLRGDVDADPQKLGDRVGERADLALHGAHRGIGQAIHRGEDDGGLVKG